MLDSPKPIVRVSLRPDTVAGNHESTIGGSIRGAVGAGEGVPGVEAVVGAGVGDCGGVVAVGEGANVGDGALVVGEAPIGEVGDGWGVVAVQAARVTVAAMTVNGLTKPQSDFAN